MEAYEFINRSAFYYGAILIALSCLFYTLIQRRIDRPQTKLYLTALIITILTCIFDMNILYLEPMVTESDTAWTVLRISHYLYFTLHASLILVVYFYVLFATQNFRRYKAPLLVLSMIPCILIVLLMITNPLTHFAWYFDADRGFHRNWAEYVMYGVFGLYFIFAFVQLVFRWHSATTKRIVTILISSAISVAGVFIQFLYPDLAIELFAESVTFMGFLLAVEYDDDRMDILTDVGNRQAFIEDIRCYYSWNKQFRILVLQLTNLDTYQRMPGARQIREIQSGIASGLMKLYPRYLIYRVNYENFALVLHNKNEQYIDQLAGRISGMMRDGSAFPDGEARIDGVILKAGAPDELHSVEDVLLLCDSKMQNMENGTILAASDLNDIFEKAKIERALFRGYEENLFQVYYQLVYDPDTGKVCSAEALLRLPDEQMGILAPMDFIPLAERDGMIDKIGLQVLRSVCRFIQSGDADRIGIQYVNVNLSMLQCMRPNYAKLIKDITDQYEVDPGRIQLEIRESFASEDYSHIIAFMEECHSAGFRFSMEGYGTGYANLYAVLSLQFDEIKLDKTLIWEADRSEYGRIILENSIRMIHDMRRPIVAVGVETQKQLDQLRELNVEYVQGFYLSKPQTVEELMAKYS